jgi:hypothetical protein
MKREWGHNKSRTDGGRRSEEMGWKYSMKMESSQVWGVVSWNSEPTNAWPMCWNQYEEGR